MKAVRVKWRDAHDIGAGEWLDPIKKKQIGCVIDTIGFVIYEDDDHLVITHSYQNSVSPRGAFAIPKVCITNRSDL